MKVFSARLATALGLLLLVNGSAFAGSVYSFVTETRNGFNDRTSRGRVLVDGEKFRIERAWSDDPLVSRLIVSRDGAHRFAVDSEARTFHELEPLEATMTSPLFHLIPVNGDRIVKNVTVESREETGSETMGGGTVRRHRITFSYDLTVKIPPPPPLPGMPPFRGPLETVRGTVKAEAVYWMAADRAPLPEGTFAPRLRTGFPEIDGKLAEALAPLRGLAVKQQVTITTEGDSHTPARSESEITAIEGPTAFRTQAALFEVPSGFRRHKPQLVMPGLAGDPAAMPFPGGESPP